MSKKNKEQKEEKKLKKEEKALKKGAHGNDLLGEIPTVHTEELVACSKNHEKQADSDDVTAEEEAKTEGEAVVKEVLPANVIATSKAPAAIGPYSQAIIAGDLLFVSGQIPINPKTGEIEGEDIATQARRVCKNIGKILKKAGTDYTKVVKTTCFLSDLADFEGFNAVYAEYFTGKPARSCVAVKQIPKNVLCEVEVIAMLK